MEAVRQKAACQASVGREPVGPPPTLQKKFEIWILKGAILCSVGDLKGQNCISFAQLCYGN